MPDDTSLTPPLQADVTVRSNQPVWLTIYDQNGMFGAYLRDVIRVGLWAQLTPPEKAVLVALGSWMRSDKRSSAGNPKVWPSNKLLIAASGLKRAQAVEGKKRLLDRKVIGVSDAGGGINSTEVEFLALPDGQPVRNTRRVNNLVCTKAGDPPPESRMGTRPESQTHPSGIPDATTCIKNNNLAAAAIPALGAAAAAKLAEVGFDAANASDAEVFKAATDELVERAVANVAVLQKRGKLNTTPKRYMRCCILDRYDPLTPPPKPKRVVTPAPPMTMEEVEAARQRRAVDPKAVADGIAKLKSAMPRVRVFKAGELSLIRVAKK